MDSYTRLSQDDNSVSIFRACRVSFHRPICPYIGINEKKRIIISTSVDMEIEKKSCEVYICLTILV